MTAESGHGDHGQRQAPGRSGPPLTAAQVFDAATALHRQGRLAEAEQFYRAVLRAKPDHATTLTCLGLACLQQGRPEEAAGLVRQALALDPESAQACNTLGLSLAALSRLEEAVTWYEKAVALVPDFFEALNNLGVALHALGRHDDAVRRFAAAAAVRPDAPEPHNNLGNAFAAMGRHEDAVAAYEKASAVAPRFAEAHYNLGVARAALRRPEQAVEHYQRALALAPGHTGARRNLAGTLAALGRYAEAVPHFDAALAADPDSAELHNDLGNVLAALERHEQAIAHFERALALRPDFTETYNNLGHSLAALQRLDEAIAAYEKALALRSDLAEALLGLGNVLQILGQIDRAREVLSAAIEVAPGSAPCYRSLAQIRRFTAGDPVLAAMETLARDAESLAENERIELHFALGKAYADCGEHERSFDHFLAGNTSKRRQLRYDEAAALEGLDRIASVFMPELFERKRGVGDPSDIPVFIVGMPRSGTTLVEQVLASHPDVFGAGELDMLGRAAAGLGAPGGRPGFPDIVPLLGADAFQRVGAGYVRAVQALAPGAARVTDKMPSNFMLVGLIRLVLPKARIVHVRRDPVDTCVSCFTNLFARELAWTYDLGELGRYYAAYERLMAHWRRVLPEGAMLEVQYEDLVADFEPQARRLLAHCGLEWDAACLEFHKTKRPVRTASVAQVRQPLYRGSVGRRRIYEHRLRPLLDALSQAQSAHS